jgi:hypothetical protein
MKIFFYTGWRLFLETPGVMTLIGLWSVWMIILMVCHSGILTQDDCLFPGMKPSSVAIEKCRQPSPSSVENDSLLVKSEVIGQMG